MKQDLQGRRVLVLGAGCSGIAAARLAAARGATVDVADAASREKLEGCAAALAAEGIALHCDVTEWFWEKPDMVVVSPGIPLESPLVRSVSTPEVEIFGELGFACRYCRGPIYAITGTNGKTTTTEMLTAALKAAGRRPVACGNIGVPLSQIVLERPDIDCLVLEVSSFQLELPAGISVDAAVILNVTPDHLDRHGTMENYRDIKLRLAAATRPGGIVVCNASLVPLVAQCTSSTVSALVPAGEKRVPGVPNWLVLPEGIGFAADGDSPEISTCLPRSAMRVRGNHNLANAAAVCAVMSALNVPVDGYRAALGEFKCGPHRLETVGEVRGVTYIDDSKATDIDATRQALRTVGPGAGRHIHLIAGGLDKGCALTDAETELRMYVKQAYLIGSCRQRLAELWQGEIPCLLCDGMEEAVRFAAENAEAGEIILLSPACASMDAFKSYAHRGEAFIAAMRNVERQEADGNQSPTPPPSGEFV
jgi:UDP-N-acetylmuramoylalanine--D-glutamate ligase